MILNLPETFFKFSFVLASEHSSTLTAFLINLTSEDLGSPRCEINKYCSNLFIFSLLLQIDSLDRKLKPCCNFMWKVCASLYTGKELHKCQLISPCFWLRIFGVWSLCTIFFIILGVVRFMLAVLLDGILYRILHLILHPIWTVWGVVSYWGWIRWPPEVPSDLNYPVIFNQALKEGEKRVVKTFHWNSHKLPKSCCWLPEQKIVQPRKEFKISCKCCLHSKSSLPSIVCCSICPCVSKWLFEKQLENSVKLQFILHKIQQCVFLHFILSEKFTLTVDNFSKVFGSTEIQAYQKLLFYNSNYDGNCWINQKLQNIMLFFVSVGAKMQHLYFYGKCFDKKLRSLFIVTNIFRKKEELFILDHSA